MSRPISHICHWGGGDFWVTRKNEARVKYREGRTASTPCDAQRTEADTARVKGPATQRRPLLRKQSLTEGVACAASIKSPTPGQYFGAPVPHNVRGDATKARRPARHQRKEIPPFAPTRTDDEIIPLRSPWHRKLVRGDASAFGVPLAIHAGNSSLRSGSYRRW